MLHNMKLQPYNPEYRVRNVIRAYKYTYVYNLRKKSGQ